MFDHITIRAKDFKKSIRFYLSALEPLGYKVKSEGEDYAGLAQGAAATVWIVQDDNHTTGMHLAFSSPNRAKVDAFHAAALKAGGRDNGKPGVRADYGPDYYGAFAFDPDNNNIEAVYNKPV